MTHASCHMSDMVRLGNFSETWHPQKMGEMLQLAVSGNNSNLVTNGLSCLDSFFFLEGKSMRFAANSSFWQDFHFGVMY